MAKQARGTGSEEPLLDRSHFVSYLETRAREMAPRDVEILLGQSAAARERAATDVHRRLGEQMDLALSLLSDHAAGLCPQIPFHTVSLLAEAVYYFLDPNDVIPDWIPDIGTTDDALIFELAFELGQSGIRRYCAWKGLSESILDSKSALVAGSASSRAKKGKTEAPARGKRVPASKTASGNARKAKAGGTAKKKPRPRSRSSKATRARSR